MTLGTSDRFSLYIWDISESEWVDYSENLLAIQSIEETNTLKGFSATLIGVTSATQKADVIKDNVCVMYAGTTLVGKFVIGQPTYATDSSVKLSGYVSTGSKGATNDILINSITREEIWPNMAVNSIMYWPNLPMPGLTRNDACESIIATSIDGTLGAIPITLKLSYDKKLKIFNDIANKVNGEWWLATTGINDSPHDKGEDTFYLHPQKGTASPSQYTFNMTGASANCLNTTHNDESESMCNRVIILGSGSGLNRVKVENFHATDNRTHLNGNLDSYLSSGITKDDATITVSDSSKFHSPNGMIRIGDEYISYTGNTGTSFTTCTRGEYSTDPVAHKAGTDVLNYGTTCINIIIPVDSVALLPGSGDVWVGSEPVSYTGTVGNTLTGCQRGSDPYAHLDDTEVYDSQYTLVSPEAGSNIATQGLISQVITDSSATKRDELDKRAEYYRAHHGSGVERIELVVGDPFDVLDNVVLGDTVTVTDSQTGLSGAYRVHGLTAGWDLGEVTVKLYLSNRKLDYSEEFKRGSDIDYQQPARVLAEMIQEFSKWDGENLNQLGIKYLNTSLTEGSSGYGLRDHEGTMQFRNTGGSWTNVGTGGSGFWTDEGAYLKATEDDVRAYHLTKYIGVSHDGDDGNIITSAGQLYLKPFSNVVLEGGQLYVYAVDTDVNYTVGIGKDGNGDGIVKIGSAEYRDNSDATSYGQAYHDNVDLHITTGKGDLNLNPTDTVKIKGAYSLPSVDGSNGQVMTTNGNDILSWSDASSGTLTGLSDTTITSPAEADILSYDAVAFKWINRTLSAAGFLSDTADVIKDTHIDWGTGATQVSLDDVPDGTSYERVAANQLGSGIYIDATDAVKGIASFDSGDFTVTSGAVTLAGTYIANPLTGDLDVNHFTLVNGYAYEIKHTGHVNPIVNVGRTGGFYGIITLGSEDYGTAPLSDDLNWAQLYHDGDKFIISTGEDDIVLAPAGMVSTSKQIQSTVATAIAPFVIPNSTAVCTNLNADLLDGYHASEFITNPLTGAHLEIYSSTPTKYDLVLYSDAGVTETIRLWGGSGVMEGKKVRVENVHTSLPISGCDLTIGVDYEGSSIPQTRYTLLKAHHTDALGIKGVWNGSAITTCDIQVYVPLVMQDNALQVKNIAPYGSEINISFANTLALKSGATTVAQFKNAYLDMQYHSIVNVQYITCSSTTLCTNLNAQYLNGIASSGFVSNPLSADFSIINNKNIYVHSDGGSTLKVALYGNGLIYCNNIHGGSVYGSHTNWLGGDLELTGGGKYYGDGSALTGISGSSLWVDISSQYIKPVSVGRSVCPNGANGNLGMSASPGEWNNIYMKGKLWFNSLAFEMYYDGSQMIMSGKNVYFRPTSAVKIQEESSPGSFTNRITLSKTGTIFLGATTTTGSILSEECYTITSGNMINCKHAVSAFSGDVIQANMSYVGNTFTGNFINFKNAGALKFAVDHAGVAYSLRMDIDHYLRVYGEKSHYLKLDCDSSGGMIQVSKGHLALYSGESTGDDIQCMCYDDMIVETDAGNYVFEFHSNGDFHVDADLWADGDLDCGGVKPATLLTSEGFRRTICIESPEVWFDDSGDGQLVGGECKVELDGLFSEVIVTGGDGIYLTKENPYRIYLTPLSECGGLMITEKHPTYFIVKELNGGTSNAKFEYIIRAKRVDNPDGRSFKDRRFMGEKPSKLGMYTKTLKKLKDKHEAKTGKKLTVKDTPPYLKDKMDYFKLRIDNFVEDKPYKNDNNRTKG